MSAREYSTRVVRKEWVGSTVSLIANIEEQIRKVISVHIFVGEKRPGLGKRDLC